MPRDREARLKAYYTHAELAKLMGISRRRVERLCKNEGIVTHRVGRRHVLWISDIEERLPAMFKSLVTCLQFRQVDRFDWSEREAKEAAAREKALDAEFERNERYIPGASPDGPSKH